MFQQAAGLFTAVSAPVPESTTEQKPTPDLGSDCALALSSLCLAQAQELVLRKAIQDQKKGAVVSKIAAQGALMYRETARLMAVPSVKALLARDWADTCAGKAMLCGGLANWFAARPARDEAKYGEEVARLQLSRDMLAEARVKLPAQARDGDLDSWVETVGAGLEASKKDNDLIYLERVPAAEDLPELSGAVVVKAVPLAEKFLADQTDIFVRMPIFDPTAKKSECIIS